MAARDTVTRRAKSGDITSCPPWRGRGKDVGEAGGGGGGGKTEEAVAEDVGSELQDDSRPAGRGRGGCEPDVCETRSRSLWQMHLINKVAFPMFLLDASHFWCIFFHSIVRVSSPSVRMSHFSLVAVSSLSCFPLFLFFYFELPATFISFGINKVDLDLCRKFRLPSPSSRPSSSSIPPALRQKLLRPYFIFTNIQQISK